MLRHNFKEGIMMAEEYRKTIKYQYKRTDIAEVARCNQSC